eukprot:8931643-Pyramimonas_sp.AAC.1
MRRAGKDDVLKLLDSLGFLQAQVLVLVSATTAGHQLHYRRERSLLSAGLYQQDAVAWPPPGSTGSRRPMTTSTMTPVIKRLITSLRRGQRSDWLGQRIALRRFVDGLDELLSDALARPGQHL